MQNIRGGEQWEFARKSLLNCRRAGGVKEGKLAVLAADWRKLFFFARWQKWTIAIAIAYEWRHNSDKDINLWGLWAFLHSLVNHRFDKAICFAEKKLIWSARRFSLKGISSREARIIRDTPSILGSQLQARKAIFVCQPQSSLNVARLTFRDSAIAKRLSNYSIYYLLHCIRETTTKFYFWASQPS